jgi:hypothetical protein
VLNDTGIISFQVSVGPCKDILILSEEFKIIMLAHGKTQVSTLTAHQQALTTIPFGNTCGEDAVSPEVAIGGCRTHVSTTRGNAKWVQNNTQRDSYSLPT